jgi:hypothetical protein
LSTDPNDTDPNKLDIDPNKLDIVYFRYLAIIENDLKKQHVKKTTIKTPEHGVFYSQASVAGCWLRSAMMVSSKPMI